MSELLRLTEEIQNRVFKILVESLRIKRHSQLFTWLRGDLQHLMPHEIMISAIGNFHSDELKLDVISAIPEVRTENLNHCKMDQLNHFIKILYHKWRENGGQPSSIEYPGKYLLSESCMCPIHMALRSMRTVLVSGIKNEREGNDSFYMLFLTGKASSGSIDILEFLTPHIDMALRRFSSLTLSKHPEKEMELSFGLSEREIEILELVCMGKSNQEIGDILGISQYTVKNHIPRIFKKMKVSNRAQAVGKIMRPHG